MSSTRNYGISQAIGKYVFFWGFRFTGSSRAIYYENLKENDLSYEFINTIEKKFKKENIFFAETRKKQKELLEKIVSKDCVILFENDLPDNYK